MVLASDIQVAQNVGFAIIALTMILNPEFNIRSGRLGFMLTETVRSNPLAIGELGGILMIVSVLYRGLRATRLFTVLRVAAFVVGTALALYSGSRGQVLFGGGTALAFFALTGTIDIPHIIVLSLVQGIINAIDLPVRQAMVVEFVEKRDHLPSAIALNSSLFNLARLIGPAIAGFVIAGLGAGMCFLVDGISYIAVITALLAMKLRDRPVRAARKHPLIELRDGFKSAFGFAPIRALILLVAAISGVAFSYAVLTPVFARDIFHGDARTLGALMSASGVGAVIGALYLGRRPTVRGLGKIIVIGGTIMGTSIMAFSQSRWLPLSFACLMSAGLGGVLLMASANTLVQTLVEDDKRGRVMSLFTMAFTGTMPLGSLATGALAARYGASPTLMISGALTLVIVLVFSSRLPKLREAAHPVLTAVEPAP
jgi:MFS family permease